MPSSAHSASQSQSSGSSNRARTRHYHKVAHTSQVDESLFGASQKQQPGGARNHGNNTMLERQAEERDNRRRTSGGPAAKKETIQIITKDLIRNLIVPDEDPSGQTLIINGFDFDRIKNAARMLSPEEKREIDERMKAAKEEALNELQERKNFMKQQDLKRHKNEKLNDLEEEERVKGEVLRQHALEQIQEQEDEIKRLNEMILSAKCHVIRDAQLLEKEIIKREIQQEDRRLDTLMEVDRQNAIRIDEAIDKKRKEERLIGAMRIMEQIQTNEQDRLIELEQKDLENRMMKKYLDKLCEEEAEKLQKRRSEQVNLREELNQCNSDILRRKELAKEQEKLIEAKVIEFQKEKAEREAIFEKEQERIRIEKEKEVARLRSLQERSKDEQAERDALRAKRAQEQLEREWRIKEADEARRKAETEAMLIDARSKQMKQKEHFLAVQAHRDRVDFERVLRAQQELIEKQKLKEEEVHKKRAVFSDDVRAQIREKEKLRVAERNQFFEEGIKLNEEARQRQLRLEEVKRKKLDELRAIGIHEKYLAQIERKINQPQHVAA